MTNTDYKGIVFFDADGTLVDERKGIFEPTAATKAAISKLKQNGYAVSLATGRAKCYIPKLGIDFDCYVTSNGAVAECGDTVIANRTVPEDKLERLIEYLRANNMAFSIDCHEKCYYNTEKKPLLDSMFRRFKINTEYYFPFESVRGISANKVMCVFDSNERFAKMQADLDGEFIVTRHHENLSADIDIVGMTKAVGVRETVNYLGLDIKDTYAFGDEGNDVDMLKTVGCGIAMTPHAAVLDAAADMFTKGVGEDGIAAALTELGMI